MAYPGKFGHKLAVKHLQQLQNKVPFLEGEPAKIWSQLLWNTHDKNWFQSFLNVCDFSV